MNMITTGAFLNEMNASDKQKSSLVNKLVTAWEQKNSKTARAGGVSLMALSLAACGSSDDTSSSESTYSKAEYDAAIIKATADATLAAEAAEGDDAAVAVVTAVSLALRNAAAEAGATTFDGMSDAAMIAAIKTSDNSGIADAAVAALGLTGISSLSALNTAYTNAIAPSAKTTYAFTTSTDSLTHATSADATFNGVVQANGATGTTIAPGDVATGAAGTGDKVVVSVAGALTSDYTLSAIQTVAVEKFLISNFDTHTTNNNTIDASLFDASMATVGLSSSSASGDTTFSGMKSLMGAEMRNGSADLTMTYNASVIAGAADAQSLTVSNITGGTFTAAGVETVAITSELAANTLAALTAAAATKVTIDGSANFTLTGASTIKAIDANAATGNVSLTLGAAVHTVTGGTGNDTVDTVATLASTDTVTGGDGDDVIIISAAATINKGTAAAKGELYNVSGFETIDMSATNDAATLDLTSVSGVTSVKAAANVRTIDVDGTIDTAGEDLSYVLNGTTVTIATGAGVNTADEIGAAVTTSVNALAGFSAVAADVDGTGDGITITATSGESVEFSNLINTTDTTDTIAVVNGDYNDLTVSNLAASGTSVDIFSADAVTASLADASGSDDTININLKTVSADNGFAKTQGTVTANNIETINLDNTGMDNGKATTLDALTGNAMKTLNMTGDSDTTISAFTSSTALVTINASTMTGDVSLAAAPAAKVQTITTGSGNDTITMGALLTEADVIDAGGNNIPLSGTVDGSDTVTASGDIGTVTDAATLKIANAEAIDITNSGAAATYIDAAQITGTSTMSFSAASGTVKLTNLGTNHTIGTAIAADEFDGTLNMALADATGASDAISINYGTGADTASTVALTVGAAVETLNVAATTEASGADTFTLTNTNMAAKNIVVTKGHSADTLALGTLNAATTNIDASAYAGILSLTTAATGAVTVASIGTTLQSIVTGAGSDTITLSGKSAANAHTVTGNGGTGDVLNITLDNAASDFTNVTGVETINITVGANNQAAFNNTTKDNGLNAATTVNISGGDSLSTFTIATAVLDDDAAGTNFTLDASSFGGKIDINTAADAFDAEMTIKGGALTTDLVTTTIAGTDNKVAAMTGVETLEVNSTDGDVAATIDLTNVTGLTTVDALFVTVTNDDQISISNMAAGVAVKTTSTETGDNLVLGLTDATGSDDTIGLTLTGFNAAGDVLNLDAAGVETLNITAKNATAGDVDVAGLTATGTGNSSITVSGTGAVTFNGITSTTTSIDGTAMTGILTVDAAERLSNSMTITGGTAADLIEMENAADVLTGGLGTDSLNITYTGILGGTNIDLSSTSDQIGTFDASANAQVQVGFENVDASGYANFGAIIKGSDVANSVTGTASVDNISTGKGDDTITVATTGAGDTDVMDGGAGTGDTLVIAGAATFATDANLVNVEKVTISGTTTAVFAAQTDDFAITGAAGVQTVTGGSGADEFTLAAGVDIIIYSATGQTTTATTFTAAAGGSTISTVGMDIITSANDKVDLSALGTITAVNEISATATTAVSVGASADIQYFTGNYDSATNIFTSDANASASDLLIAWDNNGTTAGTTYEVAVVVGASDLTLASDVATIA
jgi:hypothetical protein